MTCGTNYGYTWKGCRCTRCRAAHAAEQRRYRATLKRINEVRHAAALRRRDAA
jgi:hypothetical protein